MKPQKAKAVQGKCPILAGKGFGIGEGGDFQ